MNNNFTIKKLVLTAILTSLSLLAFMLENLFPPLFFPGAKMGISNIFILLIVVFIGNSYAITSLIVKVILGSLFSGNISAVLYSLPAGFTSLIVEIVLIYYTKSISLVCSSIIGSVINVTIQNIMFCLITQTSEYLVYLPYLSLIGILAGLTVGFIVFILVKKLPKNIYTEK